MLDIISMITLIIVFSSFGTFMMLIIIGGNMNKSIQEITSDVLNIVGNDFLPNGPIRDTLKSGYSKNKRK